MKKSLWITLGAAAAGAAAIVSSAFALVKRNKKQQLSFDEGTVDWDKIPEAFKNKEALPLTDFSSPQRLIFCDESDLKNRIIQLETTFNMRDIGGYTGSNGRKTRWGKVIRSEGLARLSDNDLQWLSDKDVKHVYDFRDEKAIKKAPDRLPSTADYTNIPVLKDMTLSPRDMDFSDPNASDKFMMQVYAYQVEHKAQAFVPVLRALAADETPILYHCTNGKDRTGFMTALILLICGVPEATIISDYSLTNLTFDTAYETLGDAMAKDFGVPDKIYMRDFFGVNPEWIKLQLKYIRDHYENIDAYLLDNTDMTQEEIDQVRAVMLEPEAE